MRFNILQQFKNVLLCPPDATRIRLEFDSEAAPVAVYWVGDERRTLQVKPEYLLWVEERLACQCKYAEKPELSLVGLCSGATAAAATQPIEDRNGE